MPRFENIEQAGKRDLKKFQAVVSEGLRKDPAAQEANSKLNMLGQQRDERWNLSNEGEKGVQGIISKFDQDNQQLLKNLAEDFSSEKQTKSDLCEAIILKAQAMLPDMTVKGLEDQISQAKNNKDFQGHAKSMENISLLTQIWDNQLKALETKSKEGQELSTADKYKKVKLDKAVNQARKIMIDYSWA